jgi:hypothetical protein
VSAAVMTASRSVRCVSYMIICRFVCSFASRSSESISDVTCTVSPWPQRQWRPIAGATVAEVAIIVLDALTTLFLRVCSQRVQPKCTVTPIRAATANPMNRERCPLQLLLIQTHEAGISSPRGSPFLAWQLFGAQGPSSVAYGCCPRSTPSSQQARASRAIPESRNPPGER